MTRIRRLLALPSAERRVLLRAFPLVVVVRLSLWVFPFRMLHRRWSSVLPRLARVVGQPAGPSPERIVWLVHVVSRYVPGAHCLTRAVAAQLLLARAGHMAEMRFGVRKEGDRLHAHAWLEYDGAPLRESDSLLSTFLPFGTAITSPHGTPR